MSEILLNKFEKEEKVKELHKQGKTIRQIAPEVHMSFRDISKLIKEYERKIKLEERKKDSGKNNNDDKKPIKRILKSSKAYELFLKGKTPVQVAIELDICYEETRKYWTEFLRLQKMDELYHLYVDNEYHLNYLFKIYYFLLRNQVDFKNIENVLRIAYDITKLYQTRSNLKTEIEKLEQIKKEYSFQILPPIQPLPKYPSPWNSYYY